MRRAHVPPTTSVSGASNKRRHVVTTVACPPHRQTRRTHTLHAGLGHHAHDHHVTVIAPPMARAMASVGLLTHYPSRTVSDATVHYYTVDGGSSAWVVNVVRARNAHWMSPASSTCTGGSSSDPLTASLVLEA